MKISSTLLMGALALSSINLSGCAAIGTAITHRHLNVQTKMSDSIFLQPIPEGKRTAYIVVHNAGDKTLPELSGMMAKAVSARGVRVVNDMAKAHYLLQVNVLKIGKASKSAAQNALLGGFGGGIEGAVMGAAAVGALNGSGTSIVGAGLIGSLAGTVTNSMVQDVNFLLVSDCQISERLAKGQSATSQTTAKLGQGNGTHEKTTLKQKLGWMRYRTRIVSTADKVNLSFTDAAPLLTQQLAHSVASIF